MRHARGYVAREEIMASSVRRHIAALYRPVGVFHARHFVAAAIIMRRRRTALMLMSIARRPPPEQRLADIKSAC